MKIALALCSALVGLLIVEGVARLAAPAYNPGSRVSFTTLPDGTTIGTPGAVRRLAKNTGDYDVTVRFNSLGFRDSKSLQVSRDDSIFVLGDSFAFGWGVEEPQRFSNVLESSADRLRRLVARRRAVILIVPSRALWAGTDAHRRQVLRTHERFVRLLRQARLRVVDVRPMFEQQGNPLSLHFPSDGNWNVAGHRIAGELLARTIGGT